jgi:polyphosphate kinase
MAEVVAANQETREEKPRGKAANLNHRTYYLNRELSWLQFNERVLEEALDNKNPLLERVKFLSIFSSNLDEFFMIRVSGLRRQLAGGALHAPPDGMSPAEQLTAIRDRLEPAFDQAEDCWKDEIRPLLMREGIKVLNHDDLKSKQRKLLRKLFKREIFPALTPLAFDPGHPFPHISNLSINLAVVVKDPVHGERFARVKVPHMFPRFVRIPSEEKADTQERLGLEGHSFSNFVPLEEVVAENLDTLFPGLEIDSAYAFRVTRDADVEIEEDEASDLLAAMETVVGQRHFGSAVRLEIDARMPDRIREILTKNLGLAPYQVYAVDGPLGHSDLMQLASLDRPELKDPPFKPVVSPPLARAKSMFSILKDRDVLLYHPYDSFTPVVDFLQEAAADPDVVAIKQTLYRVGPNSPIVRSLREARENGKQVSVLVELKARFDEENNIVWARSLERAGVHVVYGLLGLKTHAKMCLVVRREPEGLKRYVHLGTGNYNPVTARLYSDMGYLTSDRDLAADVSQLFNALTGYSRKDDCLQDERACRQGVHQGPLRGLESGSQGGSPSKGHLLSEARRGSGEREHRRHFRCRTVSRACSHLLFPQRGRRRDLHGQRRSHASQSRWAGGNALSGQRRAAQESRSRRHSLSPSQGQSAVPPAVTRWHL